jgi:trk system potassium uptake protein TrkH
LIKRFKSAIKSAELWVYFGIIAVCTGVIAFNNLPSESVTDTIRHSFFQVSSIITTTGYSTVDFNLWPELSKAILFVLMFIGGCAGSTAGGLKVARFVMLCKTIKREIKQLLHPRSVNDVKFEGKKVEETVIKSATTYFTIYIFCIIAVFLLLSFDKFAFTDNFSAAVSCFNNIGPAFGAFGPMASYAEYSDFSKVVLSFAMLFGRLEVFPMIIALTPSTWVKK